MLTFKTKIDVHFNLIQFLISCRWKINLKIILNWPTFDNFRTCSATTNASTILTGFRNCFFNPYFCCIFSIHSLSSTDWFQKLFFQPILLLYIFDTQSFKHLSAAASMDAELSNSMVFHISLVTQLH